MDSNRGLRIFFILASLFGTPVFFVPALIYLYLKLPGLASRAIFSLVSAQIICTIIKFLYPKERPVPMPRNTVFQRYLAGSFPSIHTARTTAMMLPIALSNPNKFTISAAIIAVAIVGCSRIYLKKHYFLDVAAGFAIGTATGIAADTLL